jgi:hypothetical protein
MKYVVSSEYSIFQHSRASNPDSLPTLVAAFGFGGNSGGGFGANTGGAFGANPGGGFGGGFGAAANTGAGFGAPTGGAFGASTGAGFGGFGNTGGGFGGGFGSGGEIVVGCECVCLCAHIYLHESVAANNRWDSQDGDSIFFCFHTQVPHVMHVSIRRKDDLGFAHDTMQISLTSTHVMASYTSIPLCVDFILCGSKV